MYKKYVNAALQDRVERLTFGQGEAKCRHVFLSYSFDEGKPKKRCDFHESFVKSGERPFRMRYTFNPIVFELGGELQTQSSQYGTGRKVPCEEYYRQYFDSQKKTFINLLLATDFYNGETDEIEALFNSFLKKKKSVALNWIQQLFIDSIEQPKVLVAILELMRLYSYDELAPASQMIALAAKDMSDVDIKNAAFSLFGHWGDGRALKLLEAYDLPDDPWLSMKYKTLINDIRKYGLR